MTITTRCGEPTPADIATLVHSNRLRDAAQTVVSDFHGTLGEHARDRRSCSALREETPIPPCSVGRSLIPCTRAHAWITPGANRLAWKASPESAVAGEDTQRESSIIIVLMQL